jgi:broad specificity phosphatase PhoE
MRTLLLAKHAVPRIEPSAPAHTWPLAEAGRAACAGLSEAAERFGASRVVSSREAKAAETGLLVARRLRLPFTTRPSLHEHDRRGFPFLSDRTEFLARMREAFARPSERLVGNESIEEARERFAGGLEEVLAEPGEGNPLVVSHGTVLAAYVAEATGVDPYALWLALRYPCLVALSFPARALAGTWNVEAPAAPPPP